MIVKEYSEVPQETWVVRSDTLKDHTDEVCAYVQGRVQALQYVSAGETHTANEQDDTRRSCATGAWIRARTRSPNGRKRWATNSRSTAGARRSRSNSGTRT